MFRNGLLLVIYRHEQLRFLTRAEFFECNNYNVAIQVCVFDRRKTIQAMLPVNDPCRTIAIR